MQEILRRLPKVDLLLEEPELRRLIEELPRRLVLKAVRETLEAVRRAIMNEPGRQAWPEITPPALISQIKTKARELARPNFRRVVNATGVIIHTNLGRSLLAEAALETLVTASRYYSNLEFDLEAGRRGSRYDLVEDLLCELSGAESALVVNNNAAAVLITLETLAKGREVIVSRGELVEIGGSFRIPEVMARSGAVLVEVGATNKTHLADYERAINEHTALLMKVHQSNFRMVGFTSQVDPKDLVELGRKRGVPVIEDLGSGSFIDFSQYGLRQEPTVSQTVAAGLDVTTFSGDKLLGGPQAGIILGRKEIIERIKGNPLNRAVRIDKFTLGALEATLRLYLDEDAAMVKVPTLRMITTPYADLRLKASRLKKKLEAVGCRSVKLGLADGFSQIGGGALPEQGLKTRLVVLRPLKTSVNHLEERLRRRPVPIISRIENDCLVLDVRTLDESDFGLIRAALADLDADVQA